MKLTLAALLGSASALRLSPGAPALRPAISTRGEQPSMQLWAGKKRSRYEDDGSRLNGADLIDDQALGKGWFSNFKFGTEVEIIDTTKPKPKKGKKMKGMAGDNSDRGLGGNQAYRNTESARFSGLKSQQIRKKNLEAYINSEEEASDGTFGKIISGSALLSIFGGLIGVYIYYGGDGLLQATAGQRAMEGKRQAGDVTCMTTDCM